MYHYVDIFGSCAVNDLQTDSITLNLIFMVPNHSRTEVNAKDMDLVTWLCIVSTISVVNGTIWDFFLVNTTLLMKPFVYLW